MRTIAFIAAILASVSASAGDNRPAFEQPPAINGLAVTPTEPGAAVRRFGGGAIVDRPGQPSRTVSPFGSGVIVSEPGKPSVHCSRFGSGTICR